MSHRISVDLVKFEFSQIEPYVVEFWSVDIIKPVVDLWWSFIPAVFLLWSSDEDMQSLASLMSMKQADIGNLDDFEEENEDDEENRVNQEEKAAKITGRLQSRRFLFCIYCCSLIRHVWDVCCWRSWIFTILF